MSTTASSPAIRCSPSTMSILTPHLAAVTQESRARASVAAADEMLRILRGERPRNLVNPEVWK